MAKSSVERYEQLLAQDPTSSVFVELAKALIAQGEPARAITVCEQGISHHSSSVTGRVLWGKALIHLGRPAEAMAQFDQAIQIDKENPYAYNLISEVLLQRGLYRSALPILRKAAALQPNDARVRGWMEQAQAALSGGPAPAFGDLTSLEPEAPKEEEAPAASSDEAPSEAPEADPSVEVPAGGEAEDSAAAEPSATEPREANPEAGEDDSVVLTPFTGEIEVDPRAEAAPAEASEEVVPLEEEPSAAEVEDGGLLADLPTLETPVAVDSAMAPEKRPPLLSPPPRELTERLSGEGARRGGLLDELPEVTDDIEEVPEVVAAPVTRLPVQDVDALASAYERELREKLLPKSSGAPFLSGRMLKVAAAVGALVVLLGVLLVVQVKQGGKALVAALDRVERLIAQDTHASREEALTLLSSVLELDDDNRRALALTAYTHALGYAEGGSAEARAQALAALGRPGVRKEHPGLALAVDVLVADEKGREAARKALLGAKVESSEVHALAGGLLLESGKAKESLERFDKALRLSPRNARALVGLGVYYREAGDPVNALALYKTARQASPEHPGARLGLAEGRLALGQELETALSDVEKLAGDETLSPAVRARQRLVHGRLLTALGKAREAKAPLTEAAKSPLLAFEASLALGEASRAAGDMDAAQKHLEKALGLKPDSEAAKVGLGRVLLARDREREVLSKVEGDGRQVALVRAAAYARVGDWRRARVELARTRVDDRYPTESIVYLAMADAADGGRDKAREALEKTLAVAKTARAELRTALGLLHWQDKSLDKATEVLEAAVAEDSGHYEAGCALGRLLIARGLPDLAVKPLTQSVELNGSHGEAREALGRTLLALGRTSEALAQYEAWQLDDPSSAAAQKGYALTLYESGRAKDAEAVSERAVKLADKDPEAYRVRAAILFASGDTKGGFKALEVSNRLDPKAPETFCEIALAFLRQGIEAHASKAFEAARREGPQAPCGQAGEHWVKDSGGSAAVKELEGLVEKAVTPWDKAFVQGALARVRLASGSLKEARAAADEAVKLAPYSGRSHLVLGEVLLKQREREAALKELSRAVELEPVHGLAWLALADALASDAARKAKAVEAYETFLRLAASSPAAARVKKTLPALQRQVGR